MMKCDLSIVIITVVLVEVILGYNPLIRKTRSGFVRGTLERSEADTSIEYYSFMGIPYAQPPVGKLRFKEPLPAIKWVGVRKADKNAENCVQYSENFNGKDIIGSEDCLYLNIYIPKTVQKADDELLPVMFWIHGGTFIFGGSSSAGPDYIMEHSVIVVVIQYRLNVFGFLSTMDQAASGNFGLKDQNLALRWVNENIKNFGGDPDRITIIGESAGGASVQHHVLSPKSKGLFRRAVSHSGSTMNRWAHQDYPRLMVLRLARGLGIRNTNTYELIEALQGIDYKDIIKTAFSKWVVGFYTPYYSQPFGPTIESTSETAFVTESTYALLERGIYNPDSYILGYNTEEGSFAYAYIKNGRTDISIYDENPELLVPTSLNVEKPSLCSREVLNQIQSFYFKNGPRTDQANWIKYIGQEIFVRAIRKSVELMHKSLPLYFYRFSFRGSRNESYLGGVGHHEELMYFWRSRRPTAQNQETETDKLTRKRFIKMWTNYFAYGNPTPENDDLLQNVTWPIVSDVNELTFLDIGSRLVVGNNPDQEDYEFWEDIYKLCGNPPYIGY